MMHLRCLLWTLVRCNTAIFVDSKSIYGEIFFWQTTYKQKAFAMNMIKYDKISLTWLDILAPRGNASSLTLNKYKRQIKR